MGEYIDTLGEIYLERARYLINIDEMLEEMHGKYQSGKTDKVEFARNKGAVCCGILVDTDEANDAEIIRGERLPVCTDNCKKFIEKANA